MLDRMVGYRISPLLWAKVKRGLSAGRVQSVALRMICDREDEINAFIPEEYWNLDADVQFQQGSKKPLMQSSTDRQKMAHQKQVCSAGRDPGSAVGKENYSGRRGKEGERSKKAPIPFTTSTLQQEASKALNFSTQKTMRMAQQLYEGVEVKGQWHRRPDHLSAYGFYPCSRRGRCGSTLLCERTLWRKLRSSRRSFCKE